MPKINKKLSLKRLFSLLAVLVFLISSFATFLHFKDGLKQGEVAKTANASSLLNLPLLQSFNSSCAAISETTGTYNCSFTGLSGITGLATNIYANTSLNSPKTASTSSSLAVWDVNGDGKTDSIDADLITKVLFGSAYANVPEVVAATPYVFKLKDAGILDVDGDGVAGALSDGLILYRYFIGTFQGAALIDRAISPNATRTTPQSIIDYIINVSPLVDLSPISSTWVQCNLNGTTKLDCNNIPAGTSGGARSILLREKSTTPTSTDLGTKFGNVAISVKITSIKDSDVSSFICPVTGVINTTITCNLSLNNGLNLANFTDGVSILSDGNQYICPVSGTGLVLQCNIPAGSKVGQTTIKYRTPQVNSVYINSNTITLAADTQLTNLINNLANLNISCVNNSALINSTATCAFTLPSPNTTLPADFSLSIDTLDGIKGSCAIVTMAVTCSNVITTGTIGTKKIYANIGSGLNTKTDTLKTIDITNPLTLKNLNTAGSYCARSAVINATYICEFTGLQNISSVDTDIYANTSAITPVAQSQIWDVNKDGLIDSKDSLLIVKYMFGSAFSGLAELEAARPYITELDQAGVLDVDGSGYLNATSDGTMIYRYIEGTRGQDLIDKVISPTATRTTPESIVNFIETVKLQQNLASTNSSWIKCNLAVVNSTTKKLYCPGISAGTVAGDRSVILKQSPTVPAPASNGSTFGNVKVYSAANFIQDTDVQSFVCSTASTTINSNISCDITLIPSKNLSLYTASSVNIAVGDGVNGGSTSCSVIGSGLTLTCTNIRVGNLVGTFTPKLILENSTINGSSIVLTPDTALTNFINSIPTLDAACGTSVNVRATTTCIFTSLSLPAGYSISIGDTVNYIPNCTINVTTVTCVNVKAPALSGVAKIYIYYSPGLGTYIDTNKTIPVLNPLTLSSLTANLSNCNASASIATSYDCSFAGLSDITSLDTDIYANTSLNPIPYSNASSNLVWDVNNDGVVNGGDPSTNPNTDGVIILKYLFGSAFAGDPYLTPAIPYLDKLMQAGILDIDGNGYVGALSDGLILSRYLSGNFPGQALIDKAIAADATRKTPAEIISYIQNVAPLTQTISINDPWIKCILSTDKTTLNCNGIPAGAVVGNKSILLTQSATVPATGSNGAKFGALDVSRPIVNTDIASVVCSTNISVNSNTSCEVTLNSGVDFANLSSSIDFKVGANGAPKNCTLGTTTGNTLICSGILVGASIGSPTVIYKASGETIFRDANAITIINPPTTTQISNLIVNCTTAPAGSTTSCNFNLPTGNTLPIDFKLGVGATPAGSCTITNVANNTVTCNSVPISSGSGNKTISISTNGVTTTTSSTMAITAVITETVLIDPSKITFSPVESAAVKFQAQDLTLTVGGSINAGSVGNPLVDNNDPRFTANGTTAKCIFRLKEFGVADSDAIKGFNATLNKLAFIGTPTSGEGKNTTDNNFVVNYNSTTGCSVKLPSANQNQPKWLFEVKVVRSDGQVFGRDNAYFLTYGAIGGVSISA
ncbi:MAG: hypothetical protein WCK98_05595 [bacterium]